MESDSQELYSQVFNSDHELSLNLSYFQGSLDIQNLNLSDSNDDAGIYADLCWGDSFTHCFHGVMVSFDSFDYFANALSRSLLSAAISSASDIQLNFINESNDLNNSKIVIFQKNVAGFAFQESAVAWQLLENVGQDDNHPFQFPTTYYMSVSDSWGNFTPQLLIYPGQLFGVTLADSGDNLSYMGVSTSIREMQVLNNLTQGSIDASIYKDGKLLATTTNVSSAQKTVFQFKPSIWIGSVSQVVQGQVINSATLSSINTELSLLGIASADIIMTGGGSTSFQFSLANIVMQ